VTAVWEHLADIANLTNDYIVLIVSMLQHCHTWWVQSAHM